jgi:creatinine amidohydrolase
LLEELTWVAAQSPLILKAAVVIPLGAAAKAHGPHFPLKTDWSVAKSFMRRVYAALDVMTAPTVAYHFSPAFVGYPGSTG